MIVPFKIYILSRQCTIKWLGMAKNNPYLPREQSVWLGKFLLVLSFFLPYMVVLYTGSEYVDWMIYAPIWGIQGHQGILVGGVALSAIIAFQYWFPYALIGYQAYRYASGRLSGNRFYFLSITGLTILAILLTLPLSIIPSGFADDNYIYNPYIPIPIFSILVLTSYRLLSPIRIETPWTEEIEETISDSEEESDWLS